MVTRFCTLPWLWSLKSYSKKNFRYGLKYDDSSKYYACKTWWTQPLNLIWLKWSCKPVTVSQTVHSKYTKYSKVCSLSVFCTLNRNATRTKKNNSVSVVLSCAIAYIDPQCQRITAFTLLTSWSPTCKQYSSWTPINRHLVLPWQALKYSIPLPNDT